MRGNNLQRYPDRFYRIGDLDRPNPPPPGYVHPAQQANSILPARAQIARRQRLNGRMLSFCGKLNCHYCSFDC